MKASSESGLCPTRIVVNLLSLSIIAEALRRRWLAGLARLLVPLKAGGWTVDLRPVVFLGDPVADCLGAFFPFGCFAGPPHPAQQLGVVERCLGQIEIFCGP